MYNKSRALLEKFIQRQIPLKLNPEFEAVKDYLNGELNKVKFFGAGHKEQADYLFTGLFPVYSHPFASLDVLKIMALFFYSAAHIDDVIDATLDADELNNLCDSMRTENLADRARMEDGLVYEHMNGIFSRLETWVPHGLDLFKKDFNDYVESTRKMRTFETNKEYLPFDEYIVLRALNVGLFFTHSVALCTKYKGKELSAEVYMCPEVQELMELSAESIGLCLDIYAYDMKRPNMFKYVNAISVVKHWKECDDYTAVLTILDKADEVESAFWTKSDALLDIYPLEIEVIRYVHSSTWHWLAHAKKHSTRYADQ